MISIFEIFQAKKLINQGFDGSEANKHALLRARELLLKWAKRLREFAELKPESKAAINCAKEAQELEDIANKVKDLE
jgi:hypothetical protein